jgi:phosphoribosylcarboxyaminoimidazole (NCAIR) mutase
MTVAVVMGSDSDLEVMATAVEVLDRFGVARSVRCVSAIGSSSPGPAGPHIFPG